jgi:hypothetical protein
MAEPKWLTTNTIGEFLKAKGLAAPATPEEEMLLAALTECIHEIEFELRQDGAVWTEGAHEWFVATVTPKFKNAISNGRKWEKDRENVLKRLRAMVFLASAEANGFVTEEDASRAFGRLRCRPKEGQVEILEFWCA